MRYFLDILKCSRKPEILTKNDDTQLFMLGNTMLRQFKIFDYLGLNRLKLLFFNFVFYVINQKLNCLLTNINNWYHHVWQIFPNVSLLT